MTQETDGDGVPHFTPGPWCWQQCGDKCDAPVVGIAYLHSDSDCKNPLSGCLPDFDEDGNEIEYYRETIAYETQSCDGCSASSNAALMAAAPELYVALAGVLPRNVCLTNGNVRDNTVVALECTMGELRQISAALAKARGTQ